jgi:hypothetical protein
MTACSLIARNHFRQLTANRSRVAGDAAELARRLQELPDDIAAAFLTRTEAARARAAQRRLEQPGDRPVRTEEDAAAIALAAAAM